MKLNIPINIWLFWSVSILNFMLPVFSEFNTLCFGERLNGTVMSQKRVSVPHGSVMKSVIQFQFEGVNFKIDGPDNVVYEVGELLPLIINKSNPQETLIASLSGFIVHDRYIKPLVAFILWSAFYSVLQQNKKEEKTKTKQKKKKGTKLLN